MPKELRSLTLTLELDEAERNTMAGLVRIGLRKALREMPKARQKFGDTFDEEGYMVRVHRLERIYEKLGGDPSRIAYDEE